MATFLGYNTSDPNAAAAGYTPLLANGVYTSGAIETGVAGQIGGSVYSDQAGSLAMEQSFDNINWDIATTVAVTAATVNGGISETVLAPYLRFVYTNGSTDQGVLRIFIRVFGVKGGG